MKNNYYKALKKLEEDNRNRAKRNIELFFDIVVFLWGVVLFIIFVIAMLKTHIFSIVDIISEDGYWDGLGYAFIILGSIYGFSNYIGDITQPFLNRLKHKEVQTND